MCSPDERTASNRGSLPWTRLRTPLLALACIALLTACRPEKHARDAERTGTGTNETAQYADAKRIVSLSPSITEMLFALDLGKRVVGVTSYCDYPPEAEQKPQVGGFYDPNLEALTALEPDLVVLLENHDAAIPNLNALGFPLLTVRCDTVNDILDALRTIGDACGRSTEADALLSSLTARMDAIRERTAPLPRPRVMICVGRTYAADGLRDVYIAGRDGFYDQLLAAAGAEPAYDRPGIRFPLVSQEGIIELNPDVVIELVPDLAPSSEAVRELVADWNAVPEIAAVRNGRIAVLTSGYCTIPGPRFIALLEDLAGIVHPAEFADR